MLRLNIKSRNHKLSLSRVQPYVKFKSRDHMLS